MKRTILLVIIFLSIIASILGLFLKVNKAASWISDGVLAASVLSYLGVIVYLIVQTYKKKELVK
jgi:hypothetical protein